jgi:hypothetical protein
LDLNLSQAQINYQNITTIRGDGLLMHHGNAEVGGAVLLGPPVTSTTTENEKNTNVRTHAPFTHTLYTATYIYYHIASIGGLHGFLLFFR